MTWKDEFYAAVLRFLWEDLHHYEAVKVASLEERSEPGYEWTRDPDRTFVEIHYKDSNGKLHLAEWEGKFTGLLERLTGKEEHD